MATRKVKSQYAKGAQFERDMLIHLRGKPDSTSTGWVHALVVEILMEKFVPDVILENLKVGAWRTPGSKGEGHVDVLCTIAFGSKQIAIGIQCKTSLYMSKKEIQEEITGIKSVGLIPAFAVKDRSSFKWVHSPEDQIKSILTRRKG